MAVESEIRSRLRFFLQTPDVVAAHRLAERRVEIRGRPCEGARDPLGVDEVGDLPDGGEAGIPHGPGMVRAEVLDELRHADVRDAREVSGGRARIAAADGA